MHGGRIYQTSSGTIDVPTDGSLTRIRYDGSEVTIDEIKSTPWIESETSPMEMMTQEEVGSKLDEAIGASVYPKWIANIDAAKKNVKNIFFNANWGETDLTAIEVPDPNNPDKTVSLISHYGLSETKMTPKFVEVIDSDCKIGDIVNVGPCLPLILRQIPTLILTTVTTPLTDLPGLPLTKAAGLLIFTARISCLDKIG